MWLGGEACTLRPGGLTGILMQAQLHPQSHQPTGNADATCCSSPDDMCRYFDCDGDFSNGCEAGPSVEPLHGTLGCVNNKLAVLACDSG
jgi:hypothetical protein